MTSSSSAEEHNRRADALRRVSGGVVALDEELTLTYVNEPATRFLDTDVESPLGQNIWDAYPDARGRKAHDAVEQAIETGRMRSFEQYDPESETAWEVRVHPDDTGTTIFVNDVTEQHSRLQEMGRTDTVFQNSQDGLFIIDVEDGGETFRIDQVNPAYETYTGASAGELQGKTIREITDDADTDSVRQNYRECVNGRAPIEYEERLSTFADGSCWETRIAPVLVDGEATQIVGSTRNITDRKERKRRLQTFEQMVKHAGHAVCFTDVDGEISYANPAFEDLTGYTESEILGKTATLLSSGEHDDGFFADRREAVVEGGVWAGEVVNERKDGTRFVANNTVAPVTDESGSVTNFVTIYDDITDRKERERELRRKTRALDNAPVGISITDPSQEDNRMAYVNEAFTDMTGYDEDESVGRNCRFLQGEGTDPEPVAKLRTAVDRVESVETTLRNYRKDGTEFWNQLSIAPVSDEDDELESFVGFQKDITKQKQREQRLETRELVVQAMNDAAFLVNEDKQVRFANDAALDFADVSLDAVKGRPVEPIIKGITARDERSHRLLDAIDALLTDGDPDAGEWVREPDGTETLSLDFDLFHRSRGTVCSEQRLVPVELHSGERGVVVSARDVTKRREVEKEVQTHLVQAQKVGHVGSWHLDIDTGDLQWSDECYRIFGLKPETPMTYERFLKMVHPDDREEVDKAWNEALENGSYDIEHRIVVDGETRWVKETAEVELGCDGEPESGIGVLRDITEQVQQTRQIRTQKQRYESLFNSIGGAIAVTDLDGRVQTCNPGFTDLFGHEVDEIEGRRLHTITDDEDDLNRLLDGTDAPREPKIINYRKKSGQVFPGESRSSPLRTQDSGVSEHVIHIIDISDKQESREQLQVLGRVFRHNVKNDMNVIMAETELIQEQRSNATASGAERILEKSRNFVEMAENQHRITELLTEKPEPETIDVVPITKEALSDVQREYPDATLTTDIPPRSRANTTHKIDEAIRELVQNAIVHSDQEQPSVDIQLRRTETVTELIIRDDGPGIPEQEWKVLTDETEINPLSHGTGLGLWFVHQVIRQSNGVLSFDTNDSGGTTVTVRLPTS